MMKIFPIITNNKQNTYKNKEKTNNKQKAITVTN